MFRTKRLKETLSQEELEELARLGRPKVSVFTKFRRFLGIKTEEEKRAEKYGELLDRLRGCFTIISDDQIREAEEDTLKRKSVSQIRPRRLFSAEELKQIDEIASIKRVGVPETPEIDFLNLSKSIIDHINSQMETTAKEVLEKIKVGLGDRYDSVIENIANKWPEIDRSEADCWSYKSDEISAYEELGTPGEIANAMVVNNSVENIVNIRNRIIGAAENGIMTAFEALLTEEIGKKTPHIVRRVVREVTPEEIGLAIGSLEKRMEE